MEKVESIYCLSLVLGCVEQETLFSGGRTAGIAGSTAFLCRSRLVT